MYIVFTVSTVSDGCGTIIVIKLRPGTSMSTSYSWIDIRSSSRVSSVTYRQYEAFPQFDVNFVQKYKQLTAKNLNASKQSDWPMNGGIFITLQTQVAFIKLSL